jgi:hypothetical protein
VQNDTRRELRGHAPVPRRATCQQARAAALVLLHRSATKGARLAPWLPHPLISPHTTHQRHAAGTRATQGGARGVRAARRSAMRCELRSRGVFRRFVNDVASRPSLEAVVQAGSWPFLGALTLAAGLNAATACMCAHSVLVACTAGRMTRRDLLGFTPVHTAAWLTRKLVLQTDTQTSVLPRSTAARRRRAHKLSHPTHACLDAVGCLPQVLSA